MLRRYFGYKRILFIPAYALPKSFFIHRIPQFGSFRFAHHTPCYTTVQRIYLILRKRTLNSFESRSLSVVFRSAGHFYRMSEKKSHRTFHYHPLERQRYSGHFFKTLQSTVLPFYRFVRTFGCVEYPVAGRVVFFPQLVYVRRFRGAPFQGLYHIVRTLVRCDVLYLHLFFNFFGYYFICDTLSLTNCLSSFCREHQANSAADLTNIIKKEIISKLKTASASAQTAQNRQNKISGI